MIRNSEGAEYRDWLRSVAKIAFDHNPFPEIPVEFNELNDVIELGNCAHVARSCEYEPWARAYSALIFAGYYENCDPCHELENCPGVYVLYNETDILYVGQSRHVKRRVANHTHVPHSDRLVLYTTDDNLIAYEAIAIGLLRPVMNYGRSDKYKPSISEVSRCHEYGL